MPRAIVLDLERDRELLNTTAQEWAQAVDRTKKSQIRNFYDRVLELQEDVKQNGFEDTYPFIKMLNSKVAYAANRGVASKEFQEMMQQCLEQITPDEQGKQRFGLFKLFFESVLGFFKGRD